MNDLTVALADAVTSEDVVRVVADQILPPLGADGLLVEILEAGHLRIIGSVGYSHKFLRLMREMPVTTYTAAADVLRTRAPMFLETEAEFLRLYPQLEELIVASAKSTWSFLPLIASGRAIGCCVISFIEQRALSDEERTLLTAFSGLISQALARARLYDIEHQRAEELQRGLLPPTLPVLPAASARARYRAASKSDRIGGDWYDVIPLSSNRVAMVIGDVMGHGIPEAAVMGRLRTAVRVLADLDIPPDELFARLNEITGDLGYDVVATCFYSEFDPVTRLLSFASAGHPPPVLLHPDGLLQRVEVSVDPPLGAAEPPFTVHELQLEEEALLVLYTDGLVESVGRQIDEGINCLEEIIGQEVAGIPAMCQAGTAELDRLCDTIMSSLVPDQDGVQACDDAALLVASLRGTSLNDVAFLTLPDDPRAAGRARHFTRQQLAAWGLDDFAMTTELLVSELVGNVVRHAKGPASLRLLRSRTLICEVYDKSLTAPRIRRATVDDEGGRGLQLIASLSLRWGVRYLENAKYIWVEQKLPSAQP
jgi:serine phosphatase RsbU (regulator of sigma subunit)